MHKVKHFLSDYISGENLLESASFILLLIIMAFPAIDYLLRNILSIPVLSSAWDELLLLAGLGLAVLHRFSDNQHQPAAAVNHAMLVFFLLGIAMVVMDLSTFAVNVEGFRAIYEYILFFYVGFYLAGKYPQTRTLLSVAMVVGGLIALYGIYQYIVGAPMPGRWVDAGEAVHTRAYSIVGSPNLLGSHMALLAPIGMGLFMSTKNKLNKTFWAVLTVIILTCLVLTLSRGAWLAFVGALGIMGIFYDKRILVVGLITVILAGIFVPTVKNRMSYLFSAEYMEKSAQSGRISRWLAAYDQMRTDPLFGVGMGHFGGAVAKRTYNSISVDNYYMGMLAETGLLGLGLFLYLIFIVLKKGFDAWKSLKAPEKRYLAAGILAGLLAIALHNGVENIFESPYLNSYFWTMSGLLVALSRAETDRSEPYEE
ncbi:O-antigen ligase family protein [Thermincola ferriacetica]